MPPLEPRTVLDPHTGASLIVVDQPLVLARERRDVAAQARDYLTMVAAEFDEAGHRRLIWAVHQWSTIDARNVDSPSLPGTPLQLVADGRDIRLAPLADAQAAPYAHNPALYPPEDANVVTTLYAVDPATLEYVATCKTLSASLPDSHLTLPFVLWTDGRAALSRLLTQIGH